MKQQYLFLAIFLFINIPHLFSQSITHSQVDSDVVEQIKHEGIENSQVMDIAKWLTDVYGPRLSNSPQMHRASQYALDQLEGFGLQNVHLHKFGPFGKGWELNRFSMHAQTEYSYFPVTAYPKAWSGGHDSTVTGEVIHLRIESPEDFEKYRGQLSGKFVMLDIPRESDPAWEPLAKRMSDERLLNLANRGKQQQRQSRNGSNNAEAMARALLQYQTQMFFMEEQPLAILDYGYRGWYGQIAVSAATLPVEPGTSWWDAQKVYDANAPVSVPQVSLMREHYGRIYRLLKKDIPVTLEMDLQVEFQDDELYGHNIIAEIPGTDPKLKDEVVMLGAHFDSWHASTGASDNASGSSIMMEVMRILKVLDVEPRRTIRIALWDGEEQGLYGSREYVQETFGEFPDEENISPLGSSDLPVRKTEQYDDFSAYYNLDNGTGQIRGIYLQQNETLRPLFSNWLQPFADWEANTISLGNTGSTDHISFDRIGLPGFQFIQDPIEYGTITHHSNLDYYERLVEEDLKRNAVIVATFVYHTAMLDEKLPRKDE